MAQETVFFLKRHGIQNLTNIELFSLRKDIENILKESDSLEEKAITEAGRKTSGFNRVSPKNEALDRFFLYYGINTKDFPWGEGTDDESWEYIKRAVNKAREEGHRP